MHQTELFQPSEPSTGANASAETGLLGAILIDPERCLDQAQEAGISTDHFQDQRNRTIYKTIIAVSQDGPEAVNLISVTDRLRIDGLLNKAGRDSYVNSIIDRTVTSASCSYCIEALRKAYLIRQILRVAQESATKCYERAGEADTILAETEQAILEIGDRNKEKEASFTMTLGEAVRHVLDAYDRIGDMAGMMTGFRDLDALMQGLRPSEMIVLAARPSMGKTSLAMNIAENLANGSATGERVPVGIFSCEMSQESLVMRMLCAHTATGMREITTQMVDKRMLEERLARAKAELTSLPFYIDDTGGLDVADMRAKARRMKKRHGIKLIVIDYLQLLNSRERKEQGRQQETCGISASIKAMAKELNIPVIVLSQLSRASESRDGRPRLSDLRDSGAIEQDADVVMMLRRPCKIQGDEEGRQYPDLARVEIAKNRNGECGEVKLRFISKETKFEDWAEPTTSFIEMRGGPEIGRPYW